MPVDADFYVCGPSGFMRGMGAALAARGVLPDRVHTESFGAGGGLPPGPRRGWAAPSTSPGGSNRHGLRGALRTKRPPRGLGRPLREPPGARRGVRCPGQLQLPDRRLRLMRKRSPLRVRGVHDRAARSAARGARAAVLLAPGLGADPRAVGAAGLAGSRATGDLVAGSIEERAARWKGVAPARANVRVSGLAGHRPARPPRGLEGDSWPPVRSPPRAGSHGDGGVSAVPGELPRRRGTSAELPASTGPSARPGRGFTRSGPRCESRGRVGVIHGRAGVVRDAGRPAGRRQGNLLIAAGTPHGRSDAWPTAKT